MIKETELTFMKKYAIALVVVIVLVIAGLLFLSASKNNANGLAHEKPATNDNTTEQAETSTNTIPALSSLPYSYYYDSTKSETVLVEKGEQSEILSVDLITGRTFPTPPREIGRSIFPDLPKVTRTDTLEKNYNLLYANDLSKMIATFNTFDLTKTDEAYGVPLLIEEKEFLCVVATRKCTPSSILIDAYKKIGYGGIQWFKYDAIRNRLLGHPVTTEGTTNASPVIVYEIGSNTYRVTEGYEFNWKQEGKLANTPNGMFSPSAQKFVMVAVDPNNRAEETGLLLYNADDLSNPVRSYDLTQIIAKYPNGAYDAISSVAWSPDENVVALGNAQKIYLLHLDTGTLVKAFENTGYNLWDRERLVFSPTGRFIIFITTEKEATPGESGISTLKTIDLQNNGEIKDVLQDQYLNWAFYYSTP